MSQMLQHRHWHVGHNVPGCLPESMALCLDDAQDAVRALGEAIDEWADAEFDRPECERDADAEFASGLAEIFIRGQAAEFGDEVFRVRQRGTEYVFGSRVYWAVPAEGVAAECELSAKEALS